MLGVDLPARLAISTVRPYHVRSCVPVSQNARGSLVAKELRNKHRTGVGRPIRVDTGVRDAGKIHVVICNAPAPDNELSPQREGSGRAVSAGIEKRLEIAPRYERCSEV